MGKNPAKVKKGADHEQTDIDDARTSSDYDPFYAQYDIAVDFNALYKDGQTPLHDATRAGSEDAMC